MIKNNNVLSLSVRNTEGGGELTNSQKLILKYKFINEINYNTSKKVGVL
jgi:hypothetical protein